MKFKWLDRVWRAAKKEVPEPLCDELVSSLAEVEIRRPPKFEAMEEEEEEEPLAFLPWDPEPGERQFFRSVNRMRLEDPKHINLAHKMQGGYKARSMQSGRSEMMPDIFRLRQAVASYGRQALKENPVQRPQCLSLPAETDARCQTDTPDGMEGLRLFRSCKKLTRKERYKELWERSRSKLHVPTIAVGYEFVEYLYKKWIVPYEQLYRFSPLDLGSPDKKMESGQFELAMASIPTIDRAQQSSQQALRTLESTIVEIKGSHQEPDIQRSLHNLTQAIEHALMMDEGDVDEGDDGDEHTGDGNARAVASATVAIAGSASVMRAPALHLILLV